MEFGHAIWLMVLGLLGIVFMGRLPRSVWLRTVLLAGLVTVQTEVFALIQDSPLRAFHSVLPLVIFSVAASLAYSATPFVRSRPKVSPLPLGVAESRAN
jgi:hypothetical protein